MTEAEREAIQLLREIAKQRHGSMRRGLGIAGCTVLCALGAVLMVGDPIVRAAPFSLAVVLAIHYGNQLKCGKEAAWLSVLGSIPMVLFFGIEKSATLAWMITNVGTLGAIASLAHLTRHPSGLIRPAWLARLWRRSLGRPLPSSRRVVYIERARP